MELYETLPIVPLRDVVVFPHMMLPFVIGRPSSTRALEHALLRLWVADKDTEVTVKAIWTAQYMAFHQALQNAPTLVNLVDGTTAVPERADRRLFKMAPYLVVGTVLLVDDDELVVGGQALQGGHRRLAHLGHGQSACQPGVCPHQHRTRAALSQFAAVLGASQVQVLSQQLEQRLVWFEQHFVLLAVHSEPAADLFPASHEDSAILA